MPKTITNLEIVSQLFFIWKTYFSFIFIFYEVIFIYIGLHFFHTCIHAECCFSAVEYLAGIQKFFCCHEINVDLTSRVHKCNIFSPGQWVRFWGTGILICVTVISGNLNTILLVFLILKHTCNHNFPIVFMQRSQNIRIHFDSMNLEMTESVCCAFLKNKQGPDRLLVFMSGMCYQV